MATKPENWNKWNKDQRWGYLRGLANGRVEAAKEVREEIRLLMIQFANTPLDKRLNGWEWLKMASEKLNKYFPK